MVDRLHVDGDDARSGAWRATATTSSAVMTIGSPSRKRAPPALTTITSGRVLVDGGARPRRTRSCRRRCRAAARRPRAITKPDTGAERSAELAGAVPAAGARSRCAAELERRLDGPHVGEAVLAQRLGVLRLADTGRSRSSSSIAVASRWSCVQVRDEHGVGPSTATSGGSGSPTSGLRRGLGVFSIGGRGAGGVELGIDEQLQPGDP